MAGAVTVAGPGTIGDLGAGWTVSEDASPSTPNGSANSTGGVTFTTNVQSDTLLIQDNASVFSATKGDGSSFGLIAGNVQTVDAQGVTATINQGSALTRFTADRTIPAVGSGSPSGALDLAMQLSGSVFCTLTNTGGKYWSLRGHDVGFDYYGKPLVSIDNSYMVTQNNGLLNYIQRYESVSNSLTVSQYSPNTVQGLYVYGSSPTVIPTQRSMIMYRDISLSYSNFQVTYGPYNSTLNTGKSLSVYIDKVAGTASIKGNYTTAGTLTQISVTASITSLTAVGTDFQILYDLNWVDAATFNLTVYIANSSAPGTYVTLTTGNLTTGNDSYALRWQITGVASGVYTLDSNQSFTPSSLMATYQTTGSYDVTALPTGLLADSPISPYTGTMWNYLSQVCAATGTEIFSKTSGNTSIPALRPVGAISIAPESWGISPSISVSVQGCGQNVNIKNYNTSLISSRQIYDAKTVGDSISFAPGSVTTQVITTPNAIDFVFNPTPFQDYPTFITQQGIAVDPTVGNRVNLVANPDFENNSTASWSVYSAGAIAASTTQKYTGSYSMRVTPVSVGDGVAQFSYNSATNPYANKTMAGLVYVWVPTGTTVNARLAYLNTGGGGVPVTLVSASVVGNSAWQAVNLAPTTLPSTVDPASSPFLMFQLLSGTAAAFYVDNADMEVSITPIVTAFNGNNISDPTATYGWQGIANNSYSTYYPTAGNGAYVVSDSAGNLIDSYAWVNLGGSINATLVDPNHIQLTINAPAVPNAVPGNYSLSARVTGVDIPMLSLVGSGIVAAPVTYNYPTGADPKFVQTINASDVDNVAIGSSLRLATASMSVCQAACGPTLSMTASINIDVFSAFGSIGGTTFTYQNQRWRITNSTIGNLVVSFTAIPYTTAGDIESAWTGKLVSDFETYWTGYFNDDFNIIPLRNT